MSRSKTGQDGENHDTVFLAGMDLVVVINRDLSAQDCQLAVNFFLRLLDQKARKEREIKNRETAKTLVWKTGPTDPEQE